jgi:hypothetical protein
MSEKLFVLLLRLYPSQFRRAYGDEALQLFRDRARHETGFCSVMRLWFDLLADFATSLPHEYLHARVALADLTAVGKVAGVPSFFVLSDKPPRAAALVWGSVLSVVLMATLSLSLIYASRHVHEAGSLFGEQQPHSPFSQQAGPQETAEDTRAGAHMRDELDSAERRRIVDATIQDLQQHYVSADVAQKTSASLLAHEQNGDDDRASDGVTFSAMLTAQMRSASDDPHLEMVYSPSPLPAHPGQPTPEDTARYRHLMKQQNCTIEKVEIRLRKIGYLKLNSFPDVSVCGEKVQKAMDSLNGASAVIFDLRDNRGGFPETVTLVASYLFDRPEYLFNPRDNTTERSWTRSPVPGNKLADKPVYVLTSSRTLSGAEQFCYDLKMLQRATIVGERTAGAAHAGVFYRIDDHFGVAIPQNKPINPFAETDWEGKGVDPDVKVKAGDALETAERLVESKPQKP